MLALIGANAAGLFLLRGYLLERVDEQLTAEARAFVGGPRGAVGPPTGDIAASTGGDATDGPRVAGRLARLGPDRMVVRYRPDGSVDTTHSSAPTDAAPDPGPLAEVSAQARTGHPYTVPGGDDAAGWRLLAVHPGDDGGVMVVGASLAEVNRTGDRLLFIDAAVTGTALILLGLLAAFVVRLGLRPLTRMEQVVAGITGGDLTRRLRDTDSHTEPGRLGAAVNLMLDRIGTEVAARAASDRRLRQFVADASHELRTPLTSIRGFAELYRRGGLPPGPLLEEAMSRIEGEAVRMGVLVEDLLLLAQLDQRRIPALSPVDLLEIAADTIRDANARAPGRRVRLTTLAEADETFDPPTVLGDEHRLRQVAANLLGNALQHTTSGVPVTVRVGRLPASLVGDVPRAGGERGRDDCGPVPGSIPHHAACAAPGRRVVRSGPAATPTAAGLAVLEVHDDGPGIPAEHAGRVFERLYRADPSRGRGNGGGSGLGLSIAASIAHAHGGWIELDTASGAGTTFRVLLPAAADRQAGALGPADVLGPVDPLGLADPLGPAGTGGGAGPPVPSQL
ncbi:sensor histidine kinase [Micromonospora rubida]|uniref:sensor histidine kinase n=1 Tax=Micromonospora rubida TaxID=2697657 RepID=UPI00191C4A20